MKKVSIPQSEFCPLGPLASQLAHHLPELFQFLSRNSVRWDLVCDDPALENILRFNSSVGILSVGTTQHSVGFLGYPLFQFLSRNSVRWDTSVLASRQHWFPVSIPQSEFCPLGPADYIVRRVFSDSFNSSVGILSVGT